MKRFGFKTTMILPPGDCEGNKNRVGIPGLDMLEQADVGVFFLRFLTLDDRQFGYTERYVKSVKPIVAFRTSTHTFRYGTDHPCFAWNDAFGKDVQGADYLCHMKGATQCRLDMGEEQIWWQCLRHFSRPPRRLCGAADHANRR